MGIFGWVKNLLCSRQGICTRKRPRPPASQYMYPRPKKSSSAFCTPLRDRLPSPAACSRVASLPLQPTQPIEMLSAAATSSSRVNCPRAAHAFGKLCLVAAGGVFFPTATDDQWDVNTRRSQGKRLFHRCGEKATRGCLLRDGARRAVLDVLCQLHGAIHAPGACCCDTLHVM